MNKEIRQLSKFDLEHYQSMQTDLDEDYMLPIFPGLTDGANRIFGLFVDGQLVSTAGYTVFARYFVMLGRLRSDIRYRGQNYATEILEYAKQQAKQLPDVEFVGANTESHNKAAQKVLSKIGLPPMVTLYAAQSTHLSTLQTETEGTWNKLTNLGRKREWLNRTYLNDAFPKKVFPFEAYYPFPVSEALFTDDCLEKWTFYENIDQTRFVLVFEEVKGHPYLHVVYPWSDFLEHTALWNTIQSVYESAKQAIPETIVWMDLTEEEVALLPEDHPFELGSPWMLHGIHLTEDTTEYEEESVEAKLSDAYESIAFLEDELAELENELNDKLSKADHLEHSLTQIESDLESE